MTEPQGPKPSARDEEMAKEIWAGIWGVEVAYLNTPTEDLAKRVTARLAYIIAQARAEERSAILEIVSRSGPSAKSVSEAMYRSKEAYRIAEAIRARGQEAKYDGQ